MIKFYLEGDLLMEEDPNKLMGLIFSSIRDINWWSTEAIGEFVEGTIEQLKIYAEAKKEELEKNKHADRKEKTRLTKFIKRDMVIPTERDKLINFFYKQILLSESKGLLPGFGMEGSVSNPEYSSINPF